VFLGLTLARSHRSHEPYGQQRCPVNGRHFRISDCTNNVTETEIFCRRHLKINSSTVNEYFKRNFRVFPNIYLESSTLNFVRMRWDFQFLSSVVCGLLFSRTQCILLCGRGSAISLALSYYVVLLLLVAYIYFSGIHRDTWDGQQLELLTNAHSPDVAFLWVNYDSLTVVCFQFQHTQSPVNISFYATPWSNVDRLGLLWMLWEKTVVWRTKLYEYGMCSWQRRQRSRWIENRLITEWTGQKMINVVVRITEDKNRRHKSAHRQPSDDDAYW